MSVFIPFWIGMMIGYILCYLLFQYLIKKGYYKVVKK